MSLVLLFKHSVILAALETKRQIKNSFPLIVLVFGSQGNHSLIGLVFMIVTVVELA